MDTELPKNGFVFLVRGGDSLIVAVNEEHEAREIANKVLAPDEQVTAVERLNGPFFESFHLPLRGHTRLSIPIF
jgi:hypothetical protein